ncbi:MAG: CMGC/CDK protein kinase, partial [Amphiamblys sp. WSBS2006]
MTKNYLKHLVLFLAAAAIVGAVDESVVDTDSPPVYNEGDYEKPVFIDEGSYGAVSKVREKKTGKIYALKTVLPEPGGYEHARNEINALKRLEHKNIVRMVSWSDIRDKQKDKPVHIVLEWMPCDLRHAIKNHPEIKENRREILHQILEGVAYIHSKKLAHDDLSLKNILIDPANMSVKICDFGFCFDVELEENFWGLSMDGYHQDILGVVSLMAHLYLDESSPKSVSFRVFSIEEV